MVISINGKRHNLSTHNQPQVIISYEMVVELSGKHNPLQTYTVAYVCGEKQGILTKGRDVAFYVTDLPKFDVALTNNA